METPPPLPGDRPDDVDRALSGLAALPTPRGFGAAVIHAVAVARPARVSLTWLAVALSAIAATLACAFVAGQALVGGGLFTLARELLDNEMVDLAPVDTFLALLDVVPWLELAGVAVAFGILRLALSRLATTSTALRAQSRLGAA